MPLSTAVFNELKILFNALADRVLEPAIRSTWQVNCQGASDAVEELATGIDFQAGGGVSLFTGPRGTGKSNRTEAAEGATRRTGHGRVLCHLSQYILLTEEIEISDFLISVAGAMSEEVEQRFGRLG